MLEKMKTKEQHIFEAFFIEDWHEIFIERMLLHRQTQNDTH